MHLVTFERRRARHVRASLTAGMRASHEATGNFEGLESPPALGRRIGAIRTSGGGDAVVDLNRALALKFAAEDAGAPEAEADSRLPADPMEFLRSFHDSLAEARAALDFLVRIGDRWDGPDLRELGVLEGPEGVQLRAPVPRPGKIVSAGEGVLAEGAAAEGATTPELLLKASSAVIGPEAEIRLPGPGARIDCQGALAVVIGRRGRRLSSAEAMDHVAGYTIANDVWAPGHGGIGGSFDTFAPLGPALVTRDEIDDPQTLGIRTAITGEPVREGSTKEMARPVRELVAAASRVFTLEPGDVILAGGRGPLDPRNGSGSERSLQDGDVIEVRIEGLGALRNYVRGSGS